MEPKRLRTLCDLPTGQSARVRAIQMQGGALKSRLEELGFMPGTSVELHRTAPSGDPIAVHIRDYTIALRRCDAEKIIID